MRMLTRYGRLWLGAGLICTSVLARADVGESLHADASIPAFVEARTLPSTSSALPEPISMLLLGSGLLGYGLLRRRRTQ